MKNKRDSLGRFIKGSHASPGTEFKKGEHWRPKKPYWNKDWLYQEYSINNRSAIDIANQFDVTENSIFFWLKKHNIQARSMSEIRSQKKWGLSGDQNGMYGKTGKDNPHWKGGCTPERQAFYISEEWKAVCQQVYKRDSAKCVRCGKSGKLHVHHIVSFAVKEKRAELDNLVLLCVKCHNWVHSKKNKDKKFIREEETGNDNS